MKRIQFTIVMAMVLFIIFIQPKTAFGFSEIEKEWRQEAQVLFTVEYTLITIQAVDEKGEIIFTDTITIPWGEAMQVKAPALEGYILNIEPVLVQPSDGRKGYTYIYRYLPDNGQYFVHPAYISGYPDGTFRPDQPVSMAEIAAMFYRLTDTNVVGEEERGITGVYEGWHKKPMAEMIKQGIIMKTPGDSYNPDTIVTKTMLAEMIVNFMGWQQTGQLPQYANDMVLLYEKGLWPEIPDDTDIFQPVSRLEAVVILNQVLDRTTPALEFEETPAPFTDITAKHEGYAAVMEAAVSHVCKAEGKAIRRWVVNAAQR